jgi:hypothetical protein
MEVVTSNNERPQIIITPSIRLEAAEDDTASTRSSLPSSAQWVESRAKKSHFEPASQTVHILNRPV